MYGIDHMFHAANFQQTSSCKFFPMQAVCKFFGGDKKKSRQLVFARGKYCFLISYGFNVSFFRRKIDIYSFSLKKNDERLGDQVFSKSNTAYHYEKMYVFLIRNSYVLETCIAGIWWYCLLFCIEMLFAIWLHPTSNFAI